MLHAELNLAMHRMRSPNLVGLLVLFELPLAVIDPVSEKPGYGCRLRPSANATVSRRFEFPTHVRLTTRRRLKSVRSAILRKNVSPLRPVVCRLTGRV